MSVNWQNPLKVLSGSRSLPVLFPVGKVICSVPPRCKTEGNMKKLVLVLAGLLAWNSYATEWRPSNALLRAVRQVESSNGLRNYGDSGRSLGPYQLSEAAWVDISAWRKARGLKVYSYQGYVFHNFINQAYAADYMAMIHAELSQKLRREPTNAEIYAAYNMGLGNFAECNYKLSRVNPTTARKCKEINYLVESQRMLANAG
jgi:hypothetical protein